MLRKLLDRIIGEHHELKSGNHTDAVSICDLSNDTIYDTLSIDCSDGVDNMLDDVESIDICEDMVDYYDEY